MKLSQTLIALFTLLVIGCGKTRTSKKASSDTGDQSSIPEQIEATNNANSATIENPFINSLGMKFVPVPGTKVLFCIHDTRKGDYRKFAKSRVDLDNSWINVEYQGVLVSENDDHPVTDVSWTNAKAYCTWLSEKEGRSYRLPKDHEWSMAVGIGSLEDENASPSSKSMKISDTYPWGSVWPPPEGAGNYGDMSGKMKFPQFTAIEDYRDGFATTSPVMSLPPNKLGLYDMSGNVWQWCEDWYDNQNNSRVLRGGSWGCYKREFMLSSCRHNLMPSGRGNGIGFRCVLVVSDAL